MSSLLSSSTVFYYTLFLVLFAYVSDSFCCILVCVWSWEIAQGRMHNAGRIRFVSIRKLNFFCTVYCDEWSVFLRCCSLVFAHRLRLYCFLFLSLCMYGKDWYYCSMAVMSKWYVFAVPSRWHAKRKKKRRILASDIGNK